MLIQNKYYRHALCRAHLWMAARAILIDDHHSISGWIKVHAWNGEQGLRAGWYDVMGVHLHPLGDVGLGDLRIAEEVSVVDRGVIVRRAIITIRLKKWK